MSQKEAFFQICAEAKPANMHCVSLYVDLPFYGGPEEGGWWSSDTKLVAYHQCPSQEEAEAVREAVEKLAEQFSKDAKDAFNRGCAAECEWLEARGLDDDFLPEVNGAERYWVTLENRPGQCEQEGSRGYS